jgi:hypothetical protein
MSAPGEPPDLLDLKMMPAWVHEPAGKNDYSDFKGEEEQPFERGGRGPRRGGEQRQRGAKPRDQRDDRKRPDQRRPHRHGDRRPEGQQPRPAPIPLPNVTVRFLPHPAAFESVVAQIKSNAVTYSVFALARLFLDKAERYDVRLTAGEGVQLHQLGENGMVATDQRILEGNAFNNARDEFYNVEVTQTEPLKGNFSNVARDRASGTLLGPTNHHSYQPQLRSLYEQRYSRRMSFQDFQRNIEVVSDPAVVEQWKEQARSVTTYTTKTEPPVTLKSLAEAEHHFRQHHLPNMWRIAQEMTITGVASRRLPDRGLGRLIENAWATEIRSPSQMMAELAGGLRGAGLNIFRHRKGMLFVSPVRIRPFSPGSASVSVSIGRILESVTKTPGINRKQLAENLVAGITEPAESDRIKLSLASDLRWLITEGYLIEFNDGSLDLPRTKPPAAPAAKTEEAPPTAAETETAPPAEANGPVAPAAEQHTESPVQNEAPAPTETIAAAAEQPAVAPERPTTESTDEEVPSPS